MQQERYCLLFSLGCPVFEKQYLKYMHSNLPKTFQGNLAQYLREKRVDGLVEGSELRNSPTEDSPLYPTCRLLLSFIGLIRTGLPASVL